MQMYLPMQHSSYLKPNKNKANWKFSAPDEALEGMIQSRNTVASKAGFTWWEAGTQFYWGLVIIIIIIVGYRKCWIKMNIY